MKLLVGVLIFALVVAAANLSSAAEQVKKGAIHRVYRPPSPSGRPRSYSVARSTTAHAVRLALRSIARAKWISERLRRRGANEVRSVVPSVHHVNLVSLSGYCNASRAPSYFVTAFIPNECPISTSTRVRRGGCLLWNFRFRVAIDLAKAISYFHHDCSRSSNVLGLDKSDVYSYGRFVVEMIGVRMKGNWEFFLKIVNEKVREGKLMEIVDKRLMESEAEVGRLVKIALWCTQETPTLRPSMAQVVDMIEGRLRVEELRTS